MGEDDDDGKDDDSEDVGNETAMTARMTGEDGEVNRRGRQQRLGRQQ